MSTVRVSLIVAGFAGLLLFAAAAAGFPSNAASSAARSDSARAADTSTASARPPSPHAKKASASKGGGKPFRVDLPSGLPQVTKVILEIHHRVFHDFIEARQVGLKEKFQVGDSDYSAEVTHFVPDFAIDVATRRITTVSTEPRNPAFRVVVRERGVLRDTTWAFLEGPPHFAARSLLAFQIVRIDFKDRPPVMRDTTTGRPPALRDSAAIHKGKS
jgi:hypothetical protein